MKLGRSGLERIRHLAGVDWRGCDMLWEYIGVEGARLTVIIRRESGKAYFRRGAGEW